MGLHHLLLPALFALTVACEPRTQPPSPEPIATLELTFGVYTSEKATSMYRMFTPVLEQLQERLEVELGQPVEIQLEIYKTYDGALQAFVAGKVDFVRFGPSSYVLAKQANPDVELLAVENNDGKRTFAGLIVVRADSDIEELADLRGKRFAFGDENSTIGRYLAHDQLLEAGICATDLVHDRAKDYLGRHDRVFSAVEAGEYDAGSLKDTTFFKMNNRGQLRVIASFENVTKPWVARARLPEPVKQGLRTALLQMDDTEALLALGAEGFFDTEDEQFEVTRKAMKRALAFYPPGGGEPRK